MSASCVYLTQVIVFNKHMILCFLSTECYDKVVFNQHMIKSCVYWTQIGVFIQHMR